MPPNATFFGFGEAATAFTEGFAPGLVVRAYDRKTDAAATRAAQLAAYARAGVIGADGCEGALRSARVVLSLVTAGQALAAAQAGAAHLEAGALWFDMNSVAPETKRCAAAVIEAAGGRYVDVAVMAPVRPALLGVPLLVAGPHAQAGLAALRRLGFSGRVVAGRVGDAAAIKMIRSMAVKGFEAVAAECVLSAYAAGVQQEVMRSLEGSDPGLQWGRRAFYSFERMMVHGVRRGEEMEEAAATARGLGLDGCMSAAAARLQRRIGERCLAVPSTLDEAAACVLAAVREGGQA